MTGLIPIKYKEFVLELPWRYQHYTQNGNNDNRKTCCGLRNQTKVLIGAKENGLKKYMKNIA